MCTQNQSRHIFNNKQHKGDTVPQRFLPPFSCLTFKACSLPSILVCPFTFLTNELNLLVQRLKDKVESALLVEKKGVSADRNKFEVYS